MAAKSSSPIYFDAYTCFGAKPKMHKHHPWTLDELVFEMKHCSISGALVTSTACVLYDAMLENQRLCEKLADKDFLFPLWNVMPHWTEEFPEPEEMLKLMKTNNVHAVTVNPASNGWNALAESSRPLFSALEENCIPVVISYSELNEEKLELLLNKYPRLQIILREISWGKQRCVLPLLLNFKNLHAIFDHFQINNGIEWLVKQGCENQILFGSNAPTMSAGAHRCYIDYADVPITIKRKIAGGNLSRLLKGITPPEEIINEHEDKLMSSVRQVKPLDIPVIDFHSHILDEGLNGAGGSYTMLNGGPSGIKKISERMGVDGAGLMSWNGTVGTQGSIGNECVKDALDQLPASYWGLYSGDPVHMTPQKMRQELKKVFSDRRFKGFKPYPTYGIPYDDPAYKPWWEFGNKHRLYALIHPTRGDLSELDILCANYPDMTFVTAHCGASYTKADLVIALTRKHPNLYAEITLTPVCLGIIDYLVKGCGPKKVLYGSDQPMRDPRQQLGWVVFSKLSLKEKKMVLRENALSILNRTKPSQS